MRHRIIIKNYYTEGTCIEEDSYAQDDEHGMFDARPLK